MKQAEAIRLTGSRIALLATLLWTASLPFSMAQTTRFTSIFLFSILGGFLLAAACKKPSLFELPFRLFRQILPLILLALLPLMHLFSAGSDQREFFLTLPFLLIPWILLFFQRDWPAFFSKTAFLVLLSSCAVLYACLLFQGPSRVWNSVRSETELPDLFLLARPQLGFLTGVIFFLAWYFLPLGKWTFRGFSVLILVLLLWILAKIALIALAMVFLFAALYSFRRNLLVVGTFSLLLIAAFTALIWFLVSSGLLSEAFSRDGLSFDRYPKAYVNSINSRVVLWKASFRLLSENSNWISGIPSEQLGPALDARVGELNGYLQTRHLNPHNQFLYILLHYGIPGFVVLLFFWYRVFRTCRKSLPLTGMWLFAFICSQTEIYLDREFGTQIIMLMVFFSVRAEMDANVKLMSGNES